MQPIHPFNHQMNKLIYKDLRDRYKKRQQERQKTRNRKH